ncbi:MAG: hypothetical protein M1814_001031 [Vezdaea aestivalis]|nr:MAG: hypothetical protein M1814_001031 [Vezdaea aestivalis]
MAAPTPQQRSDLNAILLHSGAVSRIESTLRASLAQSTFPAVLHRRTIALLRTGECGTFFEALEKVKREIGDGSLPVPAGFVEDGIKVVGKEVRRAVDVV